MYQLSIDKPSQSSWKLSSYMNIAIVLILCMLVLIAVGKYICRFPGCHKECFVEIESGRKHDYCSRGHVEIHQQQLQEIYQYTTGRTIAFLSP